MDTPDAEGLAHARERLRAERGWVFGDPTPVGGGRNNRLYRLVTATGQAVLVKRYVRDDRRRLKRHTYAAADGRDIGLHRHRAESTHGTSVSSRSCRDKLPGEDPVWWTSLSSARTDRRASSTAPWRLDAHDPVEQR